MHVRDAKQASHITLQANECAGNRQPRAFAFSCVMCLPPFIATCCHCSRPCTCIFTCYLISLTSAFAIILPNPRTVSLLITFTISPSTAASSGRVSARLPRHRLLCPPASRTQDRETFAIPSIADAGLSTDNSQYHKRLKPARAPAKVAIASLLYTRRAEPKNPAQGPRLIISKADCSHARGNLPIPETLADRLPVAVVQAASLCNLLTIFFALTICHQLIHISAHCDSHAWVDPRTTVGTTIVRYRRVQQSRKDIPFGSSYAALATDRLSTRPVSSGGLEGHLSPI